MNENATPQFTAPQTPPAAAPPPIVIAQPVIVDRKSPGLAGFLSMFPGLGHLYLGLYPRAFAIGGAFILLISLTSHGRGGEFFGPLIAFLWFFGVIDAVRQAKAINRGQLAESGFAPEQQLKGRRGHRRLTWGRDPRRPGLPLADRPVRRHRLVLHGWGAPAAFILLGLILIVSHVRKRRRENESNVGMPPRSQ